MKQVIGTPARKDRFYKRPDLRKKILDAIQSGERVLLSAPRRVGKTSILMDLVDNPDSDIFAVFVDTEAVENPDEFFQLLLKGILDTDLIEGFGKFSRNVKEFLTGWANKIAEISFGGVGVELREDKKISYYEQLGEFLSKINTEGKRIAILIDEFPITVENIYKKQGLNGVIHFLHQVRELRQNPSYHEKVSFIYCGSIGLFTMVKRFNATDRINDLREIKIGALRKSEAEQFVNELFLEKTQTIPEKKILNYILKKIEWWIPFYFQLLVKEMSDLIIYDKKPWTEKTVDSAFEKVVENGNIYFEHFKSRLTKTFREKSLEFVLEFLSVLRNRNTMDYHEILNLAEKHDSRKQLDDILEILKYDGYIVEENKSFRFYSPIL